MNKRKPFIVEFTGTPEAGKTTVVNLLSNELKKSGYTVKLYPESAEKSKSVFPKGNNEEAKIWINIDTLKHVIEAPFLDYDFVIFDRGAYDRIFWLYLDCVYHPNIALKMAPLESFFHSYPTDLLICLSISETESIRRRGGEGKLVTKNFVANYNRLLGSFINSVGINKIIFSTENKSIGEVVETVKNSILEKYKEP